VREHREGPGRLFALSRYRAVVFGIGGAVDLEFAREMAIDGAIASACGLEGIRVDQAAVEEASDRAVAAFAPDIQRHMIEALCGGEPATVARVSHRAAAMTASLDVFQLRPGIDDLLKRLAMRGLLLGALGCPTERLARAGIDHLFAAKLDLPPAACIRVGDRLDKDIAPAKAAGMATIQFRSGRYRKQRPRSDAETPDAVVTDVRELEEAITALMEEKAR
jgi:putative hydrolase of the HAD superfamily